MTSKRIMVIESDETFATSIESMLSGYDVEMEVIADGKTGLQTAKQNPPDMILLCVELPKMSGYSICNKLKKDKRLKSVPLIIMSSEATEETFEQHKKLKTRAEDYIIKPFSAEQISEKVTTLVELDIIQTVDDELITIEDDEDAIIIDDMPDLQDESIDIDESDDATVVMDSPLIEGDSDLDNFDDVFDEIHVGDDEQAEQAKTAREDDGLTDFDDVLDSIKEEEEEDEDEENPADLAGEDDLDVADLDIELPVDDEQEESHEQVADLGQKTDAEIEAELVADLQVDSELEYAPEPEEIPISEATPEIETAPETPPPHATADPVLTTKLQNAEAECIHLKEKVSKLEQRLEEAHRSYEKRETESAALKRDTSKDKEFLVIKSTLNTKDREILDLKEEINQKEQQVLDIKEKIGERDEEIENLQETIAKRDREIKDISDRHDDMLQQKNELQEHHEGKMAEWEDRYTSESADLEHKLQVQQEEHEQALQAADEKVQAADDELKHLKGTMEDTKQRHSDEVYGLRTRYKNEIDKLGQDSNELRQQLEQTSQSLEEERSAHESTREQAVRVPQLEEDLEEIRGKSKDLEDEISALRDQISQGEERVVKAYQKIKSDEKIKEKARKAVEIAFTLLADQVSSSEDEEDSELSSEDRDEAHT